MNTKICLYCNKEFSPIKHNQKFCSVKCRNNYHNEAQKIKKQNKKTIKICPNCLQAFKPKRKNQIYCSEKCRDLAYKKRKYRKEKIHYYYLTCPYCKKEFVTSNPKQKYCSVSCRDKYRLQKFKEAHPGKMNEYVKKYYEKHPEKKKEVYYNEKRKLQKTQHFIEENNIAREKSLQSKTYKTPYSKEEDEFLLQNWNKLTKKEIALKLNRTIASVQSRYRKLKKKN